MNSIRMHPSSNGLACMAKVTLLFGIVTCSVQNNRHKSPNGRSERGGIMAHLARIRQVRRIQRQLQMKQRQACNAARKARKLSSKAK